MNPNSTPSAEQLICPAVEGPPTSFDIYNPSTGLLVNTERCQIYAKTCAEWAAGGGYRSGGRSPDDVGQKFLRADIKTGRSSGRSTGRSHNT